MNKVFFLFLLFSLFINIGCDPIGYVAYEVSNQSSHDLRVIVTDTTALATNSDTFFCNSKEKVRVFDIHEIGLDCNQEWWSFKNVRFQIDVVSDSTKRLVLDVNSQTNWKYKLESESSSSACTSTALFEINDLLIR